MKSPAFRFYPSDFMGSPDVQAMDLHEVGAYIFLLCTAWQAERHGYLADDDERLRRWARMSREQWKESRNLLLGKFPVVEAGWRANPRMVVEAAKQAGHSASQQAKANRRWGKADATPGQCQDDAEAMPGHKNDDAGGMPSVSVSVSVSVSESTKTKTKVSSPTAPPSSQNEFVEAWNSNCGDLPKVSKLSPARTKRLSARIKGGLTLERFTEAVQLAKRTPFLRGENDRRWRCSFDFLTKDEGNLLNVLEMTYGEPDKPKAVYVDVTDTPEKWWNGEAGSA